jgi:hypothetical protein
VAAAENTRNAAANLELRKTQNHPRNDEIGTMAVMSWPKARCSSS